MPPTCVEVVWSLWGEQRARVALRLRLPPGRAVWSCRREPGQQLGECECRCCLPQALHGSHRLDAASPA